MIRKAEEADIHALVEMGRRFHGMSPHKPMGEYDPEAVGRMLRFMRGSDSALVLTNDTGAIGGMKAPVYFNPSKTIMEEAFWFGKGGRDLLRAYEAGARSMGANFSSISTLENEHSAAIDRMVRAMGYHPIERRYLKELA